MDMTIWADKIDYTKLKEKISLEKDFFYQSWKTTPKIPITWMLSLIHRKIISQMTALISSVNSPLNSSSPMRFSWRNKWKRSVVLTRWLLNYIKNWYDRSKESQQPTNNFLIASCVLKSHFRKRLMLLIKLTSKRSFNSRIWVLCYRKLRRILN